MSIWLDGLWRQNPLLTQCLGLCPLLAVSNSLLQALILGLATTVVLLGSNVLVALFARQLPRALQLQVFMALIATLVTVVDLALAAWWYEIYLSIGLFIPLIISNCLLLGRAEACAQRNNVTTSAVDALSYGLGFAWVLALLALVREALSYGGWQLSWSILFTEQSSPRPGQLLSLLPPGVFFLLALLIATHSWLQSKPGVAVAANNNLIAKA